MSEARFILTDGLFNHQKYIPDTVHQDLTVMYTNILSRQQKHARPATTVPSTIYNNLQQIPLQMNLRTNMSIVRVFSPYGTKRITVDERESVNNLFDKIKNEFIINDCRISRKPNGDEIIQRSSKHLGNIGIKHGDIVYLQVNHIMKSSNTTEVDSDIKNTTTMADSSQQKVFVQEDDIDKTLAKMDGRIYRQRNEQYCRHGPSGKCIHCVPLEPYDEQYLEHCDPPIQFISFHAYLRKLSGGQHQGKFAVLENINCKIKPGCKEHLPWPEGICTKCQPSAITLNVQKYRHVDNIMFENAELMNNFLDYWRRTGDQRIGILFGYYTTFDQAPLGIKAVVTAIYEPAQWSNSKMVELLNLRADDNGKHVDFLTNSVMEVCETLGLMPVGWIFTDLVSEDPKSGTVKHFRGTIDTYFMTAQECITAAYFQNMFPNICNLSPDGNFGSKFVTVVVTGDATNNIHFEGYQVSNQCMSLVRDDILLPTCDAPELGYIRESTSTQYVPDVFCSQKDKYGNNVTSPGRPLPVEFLLVHMTAAFPKEEQFSMTQRKLNVTRFPIENRECMGEVQNFENLTKYLNQFTESRLKDALANVHLLWYLHGDDSFRLSGHIKNLCAAMRYRINKKIASVTGDADLIRAMEQFKSSPEWRAVTDMMRNDLNGITLPRKAGGSELKGKFEEFDGINDGNGGKNGTSVEKKVWSCAHCTFHNDVSESSCQMCGLPR